jgi:hypothetical protein
MRRRLASAAFGAIVVYYQLGAVTDGSGVAEPEQVGKPQRVTAAGLGFVVEPVGTKVLGGDAQLVHGGVDETAADGLKAARGVQVD